MKKRNELWTAFTILVITISCYLVFYSRIASKPTQAGFWLILATGMAVGVFLTRVLTGSKAGKEGGRSSG